MLTFRNCTNDGKPFPDTAAPPNWTGPYHPPGSLIDLPLTTVTNRLEIAARLLAALIGTHGWSVSARFTGEKVDGLVSTNCVTVALMLADELIRQHDLTQPGGAGK